MPGAVGFERRIDQLGKGFWPGDLFEQFHAFVVFDAVGLHFGDRLAAGLVLLGHQQLAWILQRRLDE